MQLTTNKKTFILILIAFAFSFAIRLIWVQQFSDTEQFKFNDQFMINTNDGYYWAEGARDILAGKIKSTNDLSPFESAASQLTALIAKVLPFSFESIIFYMPVFFSSLLVVPLILITRELKRLEVGFIAALVGSIAWSYYNRTMIGYFDTDLLNIVFPTILLWSLIWAIRTHEEKYFLIAALDGIAYRWWYPQSYSLEFAFIGLIGLYIIYQAIKKQEFQVNLLLVTFMLFGMINVDGFIRFFIVVVFYLALKYKKEAVTKYIYYLFGSALALFFITGGFAPIWGQLKGYVFKDSIAVGKEGLGLHFFTVMQTIREAGKIPFETFANRISGHTIAFIFSIIGYIWMLVRYPVMLLSLPMVGLGFLAYGIPGLVSGGGLRFTVYAVPAMALGMGYIIYEVSRFISTKLITEKAEVASRYTLMAILTALALYSNIVHVIKYKVPTVFTKNEVQVLDKLKNIADREDYVVTWWDYGYPIRYYSDVKTLIDGGKHSGAVNFPVSYILTSPQLQAAKMARLDVEYTEKRFAVNEHNKELDKNDTNYIKWANSNIEQMTVEHGFKDTNDFLDSLHVNTKLPQKTRDIYLYLPFRMMSILPTVAKFSDIDLMSGKTNRRPFIYQTHRFKDSGTLLNLSSGVVFNKKSGMLKIGNQEVKVKEFLVTAYDKNKKLIRQRQSLHRDGRFYLVYMRSYNTFLVLDESMFNSTYIQLFVFENYDKNLFEPVILNPSSKVFKIKI